MSVDERRITRRVAVEMSVTEEFYAQEQDVVAVNISEHGMHYYRPNNDDLRKNKEVLLTFSLLDRPHPIKALAWVVEERKIDDRIASHVTFMFLPDKDEETIRHFVATTTHH